MPGPVERWLETFMCKQYADTFEAYGFKTLQSVCQLQQPQLQAMGVAQEHVEKILESVHVLRQSMFGGVNHYKDDGYGAQQNNRIQHTGYPPQAHTMGGMNQNYMSQGGYNNHVNSIGAHRGQFMDGMYQQHSQGQQYPTAYNNQTQGPYHMGQYNQQNSSYGPVMGGYSNSQQRTQNHVAAATTHIHQRHQNPQEVANNILQMAASYQPSQTVQVPLSKHRPAPYHVPVSAHYNMQNHVTTPENMNRQFNYPNASPHNPHAARTSPVSPGSMYMHSPASQHSSQSLPNSSPRSIHSPPGCGNIKSPIPTLSPAMRSPCHIQSPVNTPINQQLHIATGQPVVQSPPHQHMGYSPKNNPISPTVIHSPQYKQHVHQQHLGNQKSYISDNIGNSGSSYIANSPLQSLQKLCMLPDHQVVDPKSIVNDSSSSSPNQNQKNVNSDVDSNSNSTSTISEPASINICTDGKKFDETNSNEKRNLCENVKSSQCSKSDSSKKTCDSTVVDSYADDAVKKSAKNNVIIDDNSELQKLKYLGQPCNTDLSLNKPSSLQNDLKLDKDLEEKNEVSVSDRDDNKQQCPDIDDFPVKKSNESCDNSGKISKKLKNECSEPLDSESKHSENLTLKLHNGEDISVKENVKSQVVLDDFGLKSDLETVCDKSIVDGCENINCDEQSKSDMSTDCRKDEVKSMVNGIDDSDDVCSDVDTNRKDLLTSKKLHVQGSNETNDHTVVNNSKFGKKHKNVDKSESKMVLREIPARLASASPFYVDESDSDDDGILLVRKDVKYTYSRYNKMHPNINTHVSVSDNEIVDISDEESLDRNSLDSDISKGYDCDLLRPQTKLSNKSRESKINCVNGNGSESNPSHKKKGNITKTAKKKGVKQEKVTSSDNPGHGLVLKTETKKGTGRSKRTRTTTSKYGDEMYLGDDFVLDSEEEIEIEKKSKRKRKNSGDQKSSVKIKSEESIVDSEEEIPEIESKKSKKTKKPKDSIQVEDNVKLENADSTLDSKDICIDIIDSSDNLGDGSDIIMFKGEPSLQTKSAVPQPVASMSKPENKPSVKKPRPLNKGKAKVAKSKSRGKLLPVDDSIENFKLKKTMNLMKQKGKKKVDVPVKETGPFIRVKDSGTQKERCFVVNQQQIEDVSDKSSKNKKSVSVSTVNVSKLPSEKSVYWPASLMGDNSVWVCALCQKHSSYKHLGDLFGPYYIEGSLPDDVDGPNSSDKKGKQKRQSLNASLVSKNTKGKRKSQEPVRPQEVWVHEDCAAWADGVLLIGAKIYGLEEATDIASTTVCTFCKENGAMVGCLHKGCSQKFHYYCGIESGCFLDEENYSLLCPKHRDKRLKSAEAKSFKT